MTPVTIYKWMQAVIQQRCQQAKLLPGTHQTGSLTVSWALPPTWTKQRIKIAVAMGVAVTYFCSQQWPGMTLAEASRLVGIAIWWMFHYNSRYCRPLVDMLGWIYIPSLTSWDQRSRWSSTASHIIALMQWPQQRVFQGTNFHKDYV